METALQQARYPIGAFIKPEFIDEQKLEEAIAELDVFPVKMERAVSRLSDTQLNEPYRQGGWSIRQVVHHCADSHMNSYIRLKLALTEDEPVIKPYREDLWASLPDSNEMPVQSSLVILRNIHLRWVYLLKKMNPAQFERTYFHPEDKDLWNIKTQTLFYAWHGRHHLAHVVKLKLQKGWKTE